MTLEAEIKEIEETFFQKFNKKIKVKFGNLDPLGNWFYFERKYFGEYRLGTTLYNAVTMIGLMEELPKYIIDTE